MNTRATAQASGTAGTLDLHVRYVGDFQDEDGGLRRCYRYEVNDTSTAEPPAVGRDLYSGVDAPVDAHAALSTLVSFVSAAGEAYEHTMRGGHSENLHLFRPCIAEAAYVNADELQMLAMALEERATADRAPRGASRSSSRRDAQSL